MSSWQDVLNEPCEVVESKRAGVHTTAKELHRLYSEEENSMKEIGEKFGCGETTVLRLMDEAGIDRRSPGRDHYAHKKYRDEDWLRSRFVEEGKSTSEIAKECDVTSNCINVWINEFDLRDEITRTCEFKFTGDSNHEGYPLWGKTGTSDYLQVHRLVAIADGADPYDVFGDDQQHVHHRNGFKCDNRPENLELVNTRTHGKYHSPDAVQWTDDDLEFVIRAMLNPSKYIQTDG